MKKQVLIFATITAIVFTSCSKEKIEAPQQNNSEEISTAKGGGGGIVGTSLNAGLLGRFEFNGNLKDTTGQIAPGVSTAGRVLFTADRKEVKNRAIYFNEAYGVFVNNVPLDTNMSVSVWVRYESVPTDVMTFVDGSHSFRLAQVENKFQGGYWNLIVGQYVVSQPMNKSWHHLVATRDNNTMKFYIDGKFIGSAGSGGSITPTTMSEYMIGYCFNAGYKYWKGAMDDLRIYNRVISQTEIQALYNL